ncbi:hypothetical protein EX30DRAFT_360940 [Ascodesmis nigricans]|uniref:dolichol kinase n=1 Tax=Ascodesmis nigricans TaxID=341454 RepID=A0A4S2N797_9PEZI|nr:hypothetical protein EX30DRAFT_360940 [Ascodesmis nigricans]
MKHSSEPLALPPQTPSDTSKSPSPVPRQASRSPHPYRRRNPERYRRTLTFPGNTPPSPNSPSSSSLRGISYTGDAESGTEADDELTRRLPAPLGRRRSSTEDVLPKITLARDGKVQSAELNSVGLQKPGSRLCAAISRRVIEIALVVLLGVMVLGGKDGRAWREVLARRKEIIYWTIPYVCTTVAYPVRIFLRGHGFQSPRSFDPAPLIYPILYPILVALSLCPENVDAQNPYLLVNLVISLANLPPILVGPWQLHWVIALSPLIPHMTDPGSTFLGVANKMSLIPPISFLLTSSLTGLLYPSLTASELRLLSGGLINLLWHAESPQAVILRTMIWGGGISVFLLCEDVIKWNISLARVPPHKFRAAGHAVIGIGRFRKLASIRQWSREQQASDSEADIDIPNRKPTRQRSGRNSFWARLSRQQAQLRKLGYASAVYAIILAIVFVGLRPYIASRALGGLDPFIWAPSYVLCGQSWYQRIVDRWTPGMGYCVTDGSTETANLRWHLVVYWVGIIATGVTIVTTIAPKIEVDTRRKVFHGMVLPMFLVPGLFDPPFTHLALSIALSLFILLDLIRAGQLPPASEWIARFLEPYVDGRDLKGPMVVSHVFLLIGSGLGWWLTLAKHHQQDWEWHDQPELSFIAGVACVGMGDAAASLIGRRFGKTKWGWRGGKSVEGSIAFMAALMTGLCIGRSYIQGLDGDWGLVVWFRLAITGAWGSMVEAVATGVNDNVVVPLGVWMVVIALEL